MSRKKRSRKPDGNALLTALVAAENGDIFELPGYAAVGMNDRRMVPLTMDDTRPLPHGSELMLLPDRIPVLWDIEKAQPAAVPDNPYAPGKPIFPVAAFNSPGHVNTALSAYTERKSAGHLPLFSYGAVGWSAGGFRSAVIQVDREPRQDLRRMPIEKVRAGIRRDRKKLPDNRLRAHLEHCALVYGCPAGKNFFLKRYEAPLPTATACNARCLGCISLQTDETITSSQNRISFTPTPEEIAGVALLHIRRVNRSVVSFGQGCEGDPLTAADAIGPAIRLIRQQTGAGTINCNTNGSRPDVLEKLIDAGLDSIRVSMNSVREPCYRHYFRPRGYRFADVLRCIDLALARGLFVSINYLNCPGFTNTAEEIDALYAFLDHHPVHMIQWRNLNFDPLRYLSAVLPDRPPGDPVPMVSLIDDLRAAHPSLMHGYFNPPREKWKCRPADTGGRTP